MEKPDLMNQSHHSKLEHLEPPTPQVLEEIDVTKKNRETTIDIRGLHYGPPPIPSTLTLDERYALCLSVAEECVQPDELMQVLMRDPNPVCYDGFEPSGRIHIAQGALKAVLVKRLISAGCVFVFWIGDWFAMLNNKLGGDLDKIRTVGLYFIEIWKALGLNHDNVRFVWASEEINRLPDGYWSRVMDIARHNNLSRIKRCCQIMGRGEGDDQPASSILYPCMQCADIFFLRTSICQLGQDQRKVNMLAREYATQKKFKTKPVILSHKMLPGLQQGQEKMSKSDPTSSIFMDDSAQEVKTKIKKAFCPPQEIEGNPCVAYVENIIFPWFNGFSVERDESFGGPITYTSIEEFRDAYKEGKLHPGDLKKNLAEKLNTILDLVRTHFENNPNAKSLFEKVKRYVKQQHR